MLKKIRMSLLHWIYVSLIFGFTNGLKSTPTQRLLNGNKIPIVGLGTFMIPPEKVEVAVTSALEDGYRHIDTAIVYENEKAIGDALKKWFAKGGKREELFVASKLSIQMMRASDVRTAIEISLKNMALDYFDMFLIHVPFGVQRTPDFQMLKNDNGTFAIDYSTNHIAIWREMEKLVRAGKTKSIGLSNFNKTQILKIWRSAVIKPSNLQVETNAYIQEDELVQLCRRLGIVFSGYGPIGSGDTTHLRRKRDTGVTLPPLLNHPVVLKIAAKHNKTPAQILLRHALHRNIVVIPKSSNPNRIKENIDIFNFRLTRTDMNELKKLDQHGKYRKFDFQAYFPGIENHPEYPWADRRPK